MSEIEKKDVDDAVTEGKEEEEVDENVPIANGDEKTSAQAKKNKKKKAKKAALSEYSVM